MAQGTLGQQSLSSQQQGRVTRTERKRQADQQRVAQFRFNQGQTEAERLKSEVFVDQSVQQKYYEDVPKDYLDRYGNPTQEWINFNSITKKRVLSRTQERDKVSIVKTRTISDPFTFEEYKQEYQKLDPNVQQFFQSPTTITAQQEAKKQVQRDIFQNNLTQIQSKLQRANTRLQEYRDWINKQPSDRWEKYKEKYNKKEKEYEKDIEEIQKQIREAQGQYGKIDQGATASDIWSYAENKAEYDRDRSENRYKATQKFNQEVKAGNLNEDLEKLKLDPKTVKYNQFKNAVEQYNQGVNYDTNLRAWAGKVGFENLPDWTKEKLNPDAIAWQKANPTEKLIYDKQGNVTGVNSGILNQTISLEEYNKLANRTPDDYYKEWQKERSTKPIYFDVNSSSVELPYQTRGTKNTNTLTNFYTLKDASIKTGSDSWEKVKKVYSNIVSKTPDVNIPIWITAGGSIPLKEIKPIVSESLGTTTSELYQEMTTKTPNKENIDNSFQQEYQIRFEDENMKKIIYGETDFDTASKQFAESDTAKIISEKYGVAIEEDTKKLPLTQKWKYGTALVGLGLSKTAVDLVPTNYGDLAVKSALAYTGYKVLTAIPQSVNLAISGGFFVKGTYDAFSPTSTPIKAGGGLITAGITGATLGYAGYKYLGSPVVKPTTIKVPKKDVFSSAKIGKDIQFITDSKTLNKAIYGQQKLSQVSQVGRRTIVTTKWRDLANTYLKTDFANIYEGVPYSQKALYGSDVFRGGKYVIRESGYQNALKLLKKYGYTQSQATQTLRYYAPQTTEQWLKSGVINVRDDLTASGRFVYETKKPIYTIDEKLGIKTRGGKKITEVFNVERKIINLNDQQLMFEMRTKVAGYLDTAGKVKTTNFGFSTSTTTAKVSDLKKGTEFLRKTGGYDVYRQPALYKDIYSLSKETFSISVTPKRTKTFIDITQGQNKYNFGKSTLFEWDIDLKTKIGSGGKKIIQKGVSSGSTNVDKIVEKILNNEKIIPKTLATPRTQLNPLATNQLSLLKSDVIVTPITQTTKVGSIAQVKLNTLSAVQLGVASATALQLKQDLKSDVALKSQLKEMQQLKVNQITTQLLKQDLKTQQVQKSAPSLRMVTPNIELSLISPRINAPTYPKTPKTSFPKILFFGDELKQKIKAKAKKNQTPDALALLPDFTARSLGLKPQEFGSVKDAVKEIKKLQTGFGIRRGGRIKKVKPFNEKSIMAEFGK